MSSRTGPREAVWVPGDGIGPEVTEAALRVIERAGVAMVVHEAGAEQAARHGSPLPDTALRAIADTGVALKGPIGTPIGGGFRSADDCAVFEAVHGSGGQATSDRLTDAIVELLD